MFSSVRTYSRQTYVAYRTDGTGEPRSIENGGGQEDFKVSRASLHQVSTMPRCAAGNASVNHCKCPDASLDTHQCPDCQKPIHAPCGFEDPEETNTAKMTVCPKCWDRRRRSNSMGGWPGPSVINTGSLAGSAVSELGSAVKLTRPMSAGRSTAPITSLGSMASTSRSTSRSTARSTSKPTPSTLPTLIDGVNVTKMHESMCGRGVPPLGKRSWAWHVAHVVHGTNNNACCNLCGAVFKLGVDATPTPLKRHIEAEHKNVWLVINPQANATIESNTNTTSKKRSLVNQPTISFPPRTDSKTKRQERAQAEENCARATAEYIACCNRPFSDVDHPRFRKMQDAVAEVGRHNGSYQTSRRTVRTKIFELAAKARVSLKARLKGKKLTATGDHWTSKGHDNYSCLTVHWIEDFKLESAVLSVYAYQGSTCADNLVVDFADKLEEWGIGKDDLHFVVTDTAANMNSFGVKLELLHGIEHLYCIDHVLQLVAKLAFDADLVCDDDTGGESDNDKDSDLDDDGKRKKPSVTVLKAARNLVMHFNKSTQATEALKKIQKDQFNTAVPLNVIQDVVTRWWSTLSMVERLFRLKEALALYEARNYFQTSPSKKKARMLTTEEWDVLSDLQTILKPFQVAQKAFEGQKYLTISIIPFVLYCIHSELTQLVEVSGSEVNSSVKDIAEKLLVSFESRFGDMTAPFSRNTRRGTANRQNGLHRAVMFAHCLDPRFKGLQTITNVGNKIALWGALLGEMVALGPDDEVEPAKEGTAVDSSHIDLTQENNVTTGRLAKKSKSGWLEAGCAFSKYAVLLQPADTDDSNLGGEIWIELCRKELNAYKLERSMGPEGDPLGWWRLNHKQYPILWRLAEMYLAIPASSAPSERAFSMAGNIITVKRCRMATDTLEDVLFLQSNIGSLDEDNACLED